MNDLFQLILFIVAAYFIGSIPTSVWVGKWFFNKDVRDYGSGNAGATNTVRVLGFGAGIPVLVFDIFKSWLLVFAAKHWFQWNHEGDVLEYYQIMIGVAAVLGHIYPVYIGFKGGKGVASFAGIALAMFPLSFLSSLFIFLLVVLLTKYVSLGSIITALAFPFILVFVFNNNSLPLMLLGIFASLFIIYTHRKNIVKLWNGTENKFSSAKTK
jgi:glycerol-3-phosphate acyltransferase PlsY